ncbi:MAG: hypothetical protein KGI60_02060 [Patescibacteria group bacterium]|nr:hypothetical protein [Patescibacteria group bacterium]
MDIILAEAGSEQPETMEKKPAPPKKETLEESLDRAVEDLNAHLVATEWKSSAEDKARLSASHYGTRLESGEMHKGNLYDKGWEWYWADRLMHENVPEDIRATLDIVDRGEKIGFKRRKKLSKFVGSFVEYESNLPEKAREAFKKARERKKKQKEARVQNLAKKSNQRIDELMLMKKGVVLDLKTELRSIDEQKMSPEYVQGRKEVFYDDKSESLFILDSAGKRQEVSFGDLVGDYGWGIRYRPDASMPAALRRKIRKTLALHEARNKIQTLYNEELQERFSAGYPASTFGIEFIDKTMRRNGADAEGVVAEHLAREFLVRVQYNNPQLGMSVERSNALEDRELKYDFKIRSRKTVGVALEPDNMSRKEFVKQKRQIGIQFTIGSASKTELVQIGKGRLEAYKEILRGRVDDIVVVQIPSLKGLADLYRKWVRAGRPSGGPEQYLSIEQKGEIFDQATKEILDVSDAEKEALKF